MSSARRTQLFVALAAACIVAAVVAVVSAAGGGDPAGSGNAANLLVAARSAHAPRLLLRNLDRARPQDFGRVAVAPLAPGGARTLLPLRCERVYFAAGSGLCLARGGGFASSYRARVFGADLRVRGEVAVDGIPSRARVSPDGRYGSATLFVTGHSYADTGGFSTTTTLIDLRTGRKIAQLEDFTATRDGRTITARDINYWGVTFAHDSDRFYATLATGGKIYLVEGSVRARIVRTIHEGVECPSLSPDGTRIAYKKRVGAGGKRWRLYVLDLRTMRETPLAERRSVDDQAEWLDDRSVLYGLDESIWTVPADGSGRPVTYAPRADSPAVARW
jgi:dipeptidyl aminopeptidase/acylaminoacyl peptidase